MKNIFYTAITLILVSCAETNTNEIASETTPDSLVVENKIVDETEEIKDVFEEIRSLEKETIEKLASSEKQDEVINDFIMGYDNLNSLVNYEDYILDEYKESFDWETRHNIENYTDDFKEYFSLDTDEGEVWSTVNPDFIKKTLLSERLTKENEIFVKQYIKELNTDMFVEVYLILEPDELFSNAESWGEILNFSKEKKYDKTANSYYNLYMGQIFSLDNFSGENSSKYKRDYLDLIDKCIKEKPDNYITKDFIEFKEIMVGNSSKRTGKIEVFTNQFY